jgi:hypothetical protein
MLKAHGAAYAPIFLQTVAPVFEPLLAGCAGSGDASTLDLGHNAVCTYIDACEFFGPAPDAHSRVVAAAVPHLLRGAALQDTSTALAMACTFGLGVLARQQSPHVMPHLTTMVSVLAGVVQRPDAKDEDFLDVTENAVSALGAIAKMDGAPAELYPLWFASLPITSDEVEAKVVHRQLVELVEAGAQVAVADPARLVDILAQIVERKLDLVDRFTSDKVAAILRALYAQQPAAFKGLEAAPTKRRAAVQGVLAQ